MDTVISQSKPAPYLWLDLIRGVSALAVFTGHLRVLCIEDTPVDQLNILGKFIFFITGFGHIAVMIFFVLSGFLIIKSIVQSAEKDKFTVKSYAVNRLSRLWTVLLPALIIGFVLDKVGLFYYGNSLVYQGDYPSFPLPDLAYKLSATVFVGNIFFLQTILAPTFGTNGPLWSLCNEFWYYVIFPLLYFGFTSSKKLPLKITLIATAVAIMCFVGFEIALSFTIWLFGGISYYISIKANKKLLQNSYLRYGLAIIFILVVVCTRSKILPLMFNNFSVGIVFALLIPFLININIKNKTGKWVSTYLSDISFTLYLSHLPFVFFITSITNFQGQAWNTSNMFYFFLYTIVTLIYATMMWYMFERNTNKLKNFLFKK
ncbi:MAG: acyltransferase [Pedobacter sp.]|nr:MAG: acyltransferase [Pedobacter sp.]